MYLYDELLKLLQASPVLKNLRVVDLKNYGTTAFRIKIQANVSSTWTFQIWLNHNPEHTRYAYQLFETDKPLLRWDNAPHHPELVTNFPHHFHNAQEQILPSTLQGQPMLDLPLVLSEIEQFIKPFSL